MRLKRANSRKTEVVEKNGLGPFEQSIAEEAEEENKDDGESYDSFSMRASLRGSMRQSVASIKKSFVEGITNRKSLMLSKK